MVSFLKLTATPPSLSHVESGCEHSVSSDSSIGLFYPLPRDTPQQVPLSRMNHELCLLKHTETIKPSGSCFRMALWLHRGELIRERETRQGCARQEFSWVLPGLRSSQGPSHECPLCAMQPCWFWKPFLYPGATFTVIWRTFKNPLWGQWHSYPIDLDLNVVKHSNQVLSPSEFSLGLQSLRAIEVEMPGTKATLSWAVMTMRLIPLLIFPHPKQSNVQTRKALGGLLALEVRTGQGREEKHSKAWPTGSEDGRLGGELHLHIRKESVRKEQWVLGKIYGRN